MNLTFDQLAMGLPGQGTMPQVSNAPLSLSGAGGMPTGPQGAPSGGQQALGMLAGMLGGMKPPGGQQQMQAEPLKPMAMPIPVGMQQGLVRAILARGGVA